jgi:hypothetical protein
VDKNDSRTQKEKKRREIAVNEKLIKWEKVGTLPVEKLKRVNKLIHIQNSMFSHITWFY